MAERATPPVVDPSTRESTRATADAPLPVDGEVSAIRIEPPKGWAKIGVHELWEHRELLYFLTWRDIKVRYKQTLLGGAWAVLQPLLLMIVFSIFFGRLAKIPSQGVPYPIFYYAALLPWTYFSNSLTQAAGSVTLTPDLITKVYFPRIIIPIASVIPGLIDFAIALPLYFALAAYFGIFPGPQVLLIVPLLLLALLAALGAGLWLSALNVKYRDVKYVVPFLVQFWLFATPVAYPSTLLGEPWRTLFGLNPMTGVVDGFRWALLGTTDGPGLTIVASTAMTVLTLIGGLFYFRRVEDSFADLI